MSQPTSIRVEQRGKVGIITFDRPDVLNALNEAMAGEIVAAATAFEQGGEVGAIVLTGSGRAFAAGADISEMADKGFRDVYLGGLFRIWDAFCALRTPTIAAVNGYALGGGCEVAMMCDLLIASDRARFGQPELALGVIPGMGGTQRLTRAVGKAMAMDLILTGRSLTAEEALDAGLVSRVVPADELLSVALDAAQKIAGSSRPVAYAAKETVNAAFETTLAEGIRAERRAFYSMFALEDQKEGMAAFRQTRSPQFRNG